MVLPSVGMDFTLLCIPKEIFWCLAHNHLPCRAFILFMSSKDARWKSSILLSSRVYSVTLCSLNYNYLSITSQFSIPALVYCNIWKFLTEISCQYFWGIKAVYSFSSKFIFFFKKVTFPRKKKEEQCIHSLIYCRCFFTN